MGQQGPADRAPAYGRQHALTGRRAHVRPGEGARRLQCFGIPDASLWAPAEANAEGKGLEVVVQKQKKTLTIFLKKKTCERKIGATICGALCDKAREQIVF